MVALVSIVILKWQYRSALVQTSKQCNSIGEHRRNTNLAPREIPQVPLPITQISSILMELYVLKLTKVILNYQHAYCIIGTPVSVMLQLLVFQKKPTCKSHIHYPNFFLNTCTYHTFHLTFLEKITIKNIILLRYEYLKQTI